MLWTGINSLWVYKHFILPSPNLRANMAINLIEIVTYEEVIELLGGDGSISILGI